MQSLYATCGTGRVFAASGAAGRRVLRTWGPRGVLQGHLENPLRASLQQHNCRAQRRGEGMEVVHNTWRRQVFDSRQPLCPAVLGPDLHAWPSCSPPARRYRHSLSGHRHAGTDGGERGAGAGRRAAVPDGRRWVPRGQGQRCLHPHSCPLQLSKHPTGSQLPPPAAGTLRV